MNSKIEQLKREIFRLKEEITEREAALPVHSLRPHQLMAIEELEEDIFRKQKELKLLKEAEKTKGSK
jgi:hypothetical protein